MLLAAVEDGSSTGVRMAKAHLASMAKAADRAASQASLARLDPLTVQTPAWMRFRAPQSMTDQSFAALKASITTTGGNVQPIKVRPGQSGRTELVFGNLRLQACLELGLPVLAAIEPLDTLRALEELDASNGNDRVSLYERGCLYEAALQAGLYPSRRRLAERLGRDLSDVATACGVAQLPKEAVALLRDPRQLSAAAVKRLAKVVATDPERFAERVQTLGQRSRQSDKALALKDWLSALAP